MHGRARIHSQILMCLQCLCCYTWHFVVFTAMGMACGAWEQQVRCLKALFLMGCSATLLLGSPIWGTHPAREGSLEATWKQVWCVPLTPRTSYSDLSSEGGYRTSLTDSEVGVLDFRTDCEDGSLSPWGLELCGWETALLVMSHLSSSNGSVPSEMLKFLTDNSPRRVRPSPGQRTN